MLKNYLKIALRKMKHQKIFTLINVLGLAIGMAGALFILIWVQDECGYDRFHVHGDRTYRVSQLHNVQGKINAFANTPAILAQTILLECPEVELATSVRGDRGGTMVTVGDRSFHESSIGIADESFFQIFSFPFLGGDPLTVLKAPKTVALSDKAAKRYFDGDNPIGRSLTIYDNSFLVTGVYENMPPNSHFHFDMLCSKNSFEQWLAPAWHWSPFKTYVRVRSDARIPDLQSKLDRIAITRMCGDDYADFVAAGNSKTLPLQPLTDIHLHSHVLGEFEANGNVMHVRFFFIIAGFILLIAGVNYMNLSTARSAGRALEVGIRKTVGSSRLSLVRQFLSESVLISLLALALTLLVVYAAMPGFRQLVAKPWLPVPYIQSPILLFPLVILAALIGILAGLYPALFLSSVKPIAVLGGRFRFGMKHSKLRNGLVVLQFTLSIVLLSSTLIVKKQMAYVQNKNLGFQREHVVVLHTLGLIDRRLPAFKQALLNHPDIKAASASSSIPGKAYTYVGFHVRGSKDNWPGTIRVAADADFMKVMQLEMADGRFFDKTIFSDRKAVILNQSKARSVGMNDLYKQRIQIGGYGDEPFHVIGIVNDFHYESFHEPVKPLGIVLLSDGLGQPEDFVSVRVRGNDTRDTIAHIKKVWEAFIPGAAFDFAFLDTIYDAQYRNEMRMSGIFTIFTLFAIFVACLGLLGLVSFAVEQRTKEIGIRKVLGASIHRLILLLSGEFIRWVALANLIAWPLAYYLMNRWLQNFAYRTSVGVRPFILSTLLILGISALTVGFHSARAALANPIDSLRYE